GGDALGHGAGGDDHHFPALNEAHALLGGHDDVLVVGQHEHGLGGGAGDLPQNVLGGGAHGLTAGDDAVHAQVPEHGGQAAAGTHGHHAVLLLGGDDTGLFLLGLLGLFQNLG